MADVELVVKISEEDYKTLININDSNLPSIIARKNLYKALRDSTPLPKGHGRLIYAKDVGEYLTLADVPTIIEADKAESEVDNGNDD